MTMDAKTRVEQTILHQEVDRVAKGELVLDDQVLSAHYNIPEVHFEHRWDFAKELSLDLITHFPRYIRDQGLPTMDLNLPDLKQWAVHTDLFHFYVLDGAFETGLAHFGFGDFCAMVMTEDEELEDFVHHMERINMESIRKLADQGANGILLADDVAIQQGMILRPEQFKDAFLASMERQVDLIRKLDLIPFFHSDGNYLAIADDLVNAGFSGLHCIDKMCGVTLDALKEYRKKLCLWGHLDVYDMEQAQQPEGLEQIVDNIQQNTQFEGFILGTNSGLFKGMDLKALQKIHQETDARKNR